MMLIIMIMITLSVSLFVAKEEKKSFAIVKEMVKINSIEVSIDANKLDEKYLNGDLGVKSWNWFRGPPGKEYIF